MKKSDLYLVLAFFIQSMTFKLTSISSLYESTEYVYLNVLYCKLYRSKYCAQSACAEISFTKILPLPTDLLLTSCHLQL